MNKAKYIPIDVESILNYGIENLNTGIGWPLSWIDFLSIEDKVKQVLNKHIRSYSEFTDLITIDYKIFMEYANFIYALHVLKHIARNPLISKNNHYFKGIYEQGIPVTPFILFPNASDIPSRFNKNVIYVKKYLKANHFNISKLFSKQKYILLESYSNHALEYLQKQYSGRIFPISFWDVYKRGHDVFFDAGTEKKIQQLTDSIISDVNQVAGEYDVMLTALHLSYLNNTTFDLFFKTFYALKKVQKGLNRRTIDLFLGANSSFPSRILSVAVRGSGGHVHGFTHGEPIVYDWDKISWMELSLNDFYYEYTDSIADELRSEMIKNPGPNNNHCVIKSVNTENFQKIAKTSDKKPNKTINKTMIIGNSYQDIGYSAVTSIPSFIQLHLEYSLAKQLLNSGYEVVYKPHPGLYFADKEIAFMPEGVEVLYSPFEENLNYVDAFLFYYTRTTTFGLALCTNKPIVVIDGGWEKINMNMFKALKKRCRFVPAEINGDNLLEVDINAINKALLNEKNETNTEFYETYLSA
ncbi:MAG: hypothetical protein K8R74_02420 [Bacteroidales bacterium]|nr:hypothetical protein [Bacteroidales bacterium]